MLVRNSSSCQETHSRRSTLSGASSGSSSSTQSCRQKLPAVTSSVQSGGKGGDGSKPCSDSSSRQLPAGLPPVRGASG
jgi:hypothetical protein